MRTESREAAARVCGGRVPGAAVGARPAGIASVRAPACGAERRRHGASQRKGDLLSSPNRHGGGSAGFRSGGAARPGAGRRAPAGHKRKVYGQNFLHDRQAVADLVAFADPGPGDLVLEVGAGEGHITRALAAVCREVTAYEIDGRLARGLRRRLDGVPNVAVVQGDFLRADPPSEPFSVVANIPYGITSKIIRWCLEAAHFRAATLITQLEYARKRTGDYGRWSLVTVESWPEYEWRMGSRISRERFRPVPSVDSATMRLERRRRPLLPPDRIDDFRDLAALGFGGVGGSLHASLSREFPARRVAAALRAAGVPRDTVVAFVTPDQWIRIFRELW